MSPRRRARERPDTVVVAELRIGRDYVTKLDAPKEINEGMKFASLSDVRGIQQSGWYWISSVGREVEPRVVEGRGYAGRTFEGVPKEAGDFKDNKDGTFTELRDYRDVKWEDRVYVSPEAATMARNDNGPLALLVFSDDYIYRRFTLLPNNSPDDVARVASVPKDQADSEVAGPKVDATLVSSFRAIVEQITPVSADPPITSVSRSFTIDEIDVLIAVLRAIE